MMRVQVQTLRAPRWLGPLLVLMALAILPFALMVGLAVMSLVVGASLLRLLLPSPEKRTLENRMPAAGRAVADSSAIDAEYEVKDDHEKGN